MIPQVCVFIMYSGEKTEISFDLNAKLVEDQQHTAPAPSAAGSSRVAAPATEGDEVGLLSCVLHELRLFSECQLEKRGKTLLMFLPDALIFFRVKVEVSVSTLIS